MLYSVVYALHVYFIYNIVSTNTFMGYGYGVYRHF
jgi:hypothetical protein